MQSRTWVTGSLNLVVSANDPRCGPLQRRGLDMRRARLFKLEAEANHGAVRFLSGLHVHLEEGKTTSWVTVTRTGKFSDPRYGQFEISKEMLLSMVRNFEARTYGQDIFIDVSHRPDNGAAGKIVKLAVEGDRLRALVEWTPYGVEAIKSKGYQYLSAEFHENWQDNEANQKHGCVLLGAGLTVRPVIKRLDPVLLSEASGDTPTYLHPELQSTLLQEIQTMKEKMLKALRAKLAAKKLAESVIGTILAAYEKALGEVTDEAKAEALLNEFDAMGVKLAEEIGDKPASITLAMAAPTGLTAEDVAKLLAEAREKEATEAKQLAEKREGNLKLLSDTINAVQGLDDATKKALSDDVADLVTPEMTADQVKKLAENQIKHGNEVAAAKKLTSMGFQFPAGQVHITVDSSNEVMALQEEVDKRMYAGMPEYKRYSLSDGRPIEANKPLVEKALALYDAQNGRRLHEEYRAHKRLAAGDSLVSDVSVPAIFERTVLREALYQLVGLGLCDVGTDAFSSVVQIPYSYRDTTAAGASAARKYEGGAIARAAVKQALEEARPIPQKLAFEVSDELRYLVGNNQINFDIVAENAMNATRIIGEDTEGLIFNEHLNAADQYLSTAVVNEAVATADGTKTIFVLDHFPVVRPKKVYDLQGNQVGSTLYGVTVKSNSVAITEYDGTGTQSAGMYYTMNYNLGEIQFVSEAGAPVAPTNLHAIVASYTYTTNVFKWDSDLGSVAVDAKYDDFLYRFGLRKTVIEDRAYRATVGIMSGTLMTQVEQAKQFGANSKRPGTDLMADGNLGRIKDVPSFRSYAPGLNMGDVRTVIGERNTVRFRMLKPWTMGELENQKDSNGRFTGKKEAYGDQFVVVHTPQLLKGALTSMVVYSSSGRIDRAA